METSFKESFEKTRIAGSIASGALDEVAKITQPGVTTEKIDKLCYFNICCLDQEIEIRTHQLKTNFYLLMYYENSDDHESYQNIKQKNFYIISRNNFIKNF